MDFKSIAKTIALLSMTLSVIFLLEIVIAFVFDEAFGILAMFDGSLFLFGGTIWFVLRRYRIRLGIRESILSVNVLWILLGCIGAVPLIAYTDVSFASAFFEAVSGFTTTGATIYNDIESLPKTVLFHRSLMHWLGGLGVIVLGVGLLSMINPSGSLSLFKAESTGIRLEKITPRIKDTALRLWGVYLLLTLGDTALLYIFGMDWFDALNHAFSTVSTGGFSTKNASMGAFSQDGIIWTTTVFMILSAINFLAHLRLFYGDFSGYASEEVRVFLVSGFILSILLTAVHVDNSNDSFYHAFKHASFTIASVMTTTGFATIDYGQWSHLAIAVIFVAMMIGGNAGSTAGGIKVVRYVVVFKTLSAELRKILHPNEIVGVFLEGVRQHQRVVAATFGFFVLFFLTVMGVTIYIYARGYDAMTAVSGAFALVGNVGPGFSLVGPSDNFSFFSDIDKIFFSGAMIAGRLECYTFFILFSLSFWKRF